MADLVVALVVLGSAVGALRRGVLAALAAAVSTAVVCWLVAAAVIALAPAPVGRAVAHSRFAATSHPPAWAVHEVRGWLAGAAAHHR